MRRIREFQGNGVYSRKKFDEASFRAGKAAEVAQKIGRVISRRLMTKIGVSPVPEQFLMKGERFDGYFAFVGTKRALRFNFKKGSSDVLQSIDEFRSADDLTPEVNINLMGYNIIQVIDMVIDVINGEWHRYEESSSRRRHGRKRLDERMKLSAMVGQWLSDNPDIALTAVKGKLRFSDYTENFLTYIKTKFNSSKSKITAGSLQYNAKLAIEDGLVPKINPNEAKNIGSISVEKGVEPQKFLENPELKALYGQVFDDEATNAIEALQFLEEDAIRIANMSPGLPGLFIHGKAGVGKTKTLMDVLKKKGVSPVMIDIPIGRWDNFLQVVWENPEGKVIVFDDNDTILQNEKVVGLLKKLLDSNPVRTLEVNPAKKLPSGEIAEGEIVFTSKIVFVSNYMLKDIEKSPHLSAIKSRLKGAFHFINFTPKELTTIIRERISGFAKNVPGATDNIVSETLDFVESIQSIIKPEDFDFRVFNYCVGFRVAAEEVGSSMWKKRILKMVHDPSKW